MFSQFLTEKEKAYLIKSLDVHGITTEELGFEKKWVPDSFLLNVVKDLMNDPLKAPCYLETTINQIEQHKDSVSGLVVLLNNNLDLKISPQDVREIKAKNKGNTSDTSIAEAVRLIKTTIQVGEYYLRRSIKNITPEELNKLVMMLPTLWIDEDDSLSKFKGVLHREFGREIDTGVKVEIETILQLVRKIDRKSLALACLTWVIGTERVLVIANELKHNNFPVFEADCGKVYYYEETPWGKLVIGSEENNRYEGDYTIVIDLGGNDSYRGRIGSGLGIFSQPFSLVIDCEGNDFYDTRDKLFSLGAGLLGCGIIVDQNGNDIYLGSHYSIATGLLGLGLVWDQNGDDLYTAGCFSLGAGNWGIGMLLDNQGSDTYRGYEFSQAFSSSWGYGLLADFEGNDLYYAGGRYLHTPLLPKDHRSLSQGFSIGFRPLAAGGISLLYDKAGQDNYNVGAFGQGSSYWYSLGMLYDKAGNDFYNATEYAQGAGIHLSVGILLDEEGSDHYFSRLGPAQGEGHDLSVGILIDKRGNDSYLTSGGQGVGLTNSVGIFLDAEGDDFYGSREAGIRQGSANWSRGFGGIGVFLDLGGNDIYPQEEIFSNNQYWTQTVFGSGIDTALQMPAEEEIIQEEPDTTISKIEEIFKMAALWEVGNARKKVKWAREKLKESPNEAIDYIFANKITTKDGLELRAIEDLAKSYPDSFKPRLYQALYHQDRWARANAAYLLGKIKVDDAQDSLYRAYREKRIRARTMISALEDIGDSSSFHIIYRFLSYPEEPTRIAAARALGKLKTPRAIPCLYRALDDKYFTVRIAAESALVALGDFTLRYLLNLRPNPKSIGILGVLGVNLDSLSYQETRTEIINRIIPYLKHPKAAIRLKAVEALGRFSEAKPTLEENLAQETDKFVISKYRQVLK
ncbi:MAG: HEAT repeat domain-containing protein [candidate division WOR-3 bacterium]